MTLKRNRARKFRVPRGFAGRAESPYGDVLGIGARRSTPRTLASAVMAVAAHGFVFGLALWTAKSPPPPQPVKKEIPIIVAAPPPKPPEPPKPPPPPQARRIIPVHHAITPPPPTQAAKVIAAQPDPAQPVDLTSFTMPVGQGDVYLGGETATNGSGTKPIMD